MFLYRFRPLMEIQNEETTQYFYVNSTTYELALRQAVIHFQLPVENLRGKQVCESACS